MPVSKCLMTVVVPDTPGSGGTGEGRLPGGGVTPPGAVMDGTVSSRVAIRLRDGTRGHRLKISGYV